MASGNGYKPAPRKRLAGAGGFVLAAQRHHVIGSDAHSDILLPKRAPRWIGTCEFDGNNVTLNVEDQTVVEVNGVRTTEALLDADQEAVPSFITFNDMWMVVVRRSKGGGIRLWDNTQQERRIFPRRQWYPVKEAFRIPAIYTRYDQLKIVKIPDILGAVQDEEIHGHVSFEFNGAQHDLIATELPDHRLFIQFMDLTNGSDQRQPHLSVRTLLLHRCLSGGRAILC
jgi:Protein of unknown function (DUF1684)